MKKIILFAMILSSLFLVPTVFAFGEVAGPVVFNVPIGGSVVGIWGISNDQPITVKLSAEGNIAQYISMPDSVTLEGSNKIYWINVTVKIPADYNISQGTNITGTLYAVAEGNPGQVQINLRLQKNSYIIVEPKATESSNSNSNFISGLFTLQIFGLPATAVVLAVVVIFALIYFARKRKRGVKI